VWTSAGHDGLQWAGRVECIQDDTERRRFNDPEALLSYLRTVVGAAPVPEDAGSTQPADHRDVSMKDLCTTDL
jgi:hypothetical protein